MVRYDNLFLLILSLAVFELMSRIGDLQDILQKIFNNLAGASFDIYLVHKIVIALVEKGLPNVIKNKPVTTLANAKNALGLKYFLNTRNLL